jgi:hypothetical protein
MLNIKKKKNPYINFDLADAIALTVLMIGVMFSISKFCLNNKANADEIPARHVIQMSDEEMCVVSKACLNENNAEKIEYTMVFEDNMQRRYEFLVSPAMYNLYKVGDIVNLSCSVTMNSLVD